MAVDLPAWRTRLLQLVVLTARLAPSYWHACQTRDRVFLPLQAMKKVISAHPAPITVPVRMAEQPAGTPAQQEFRRAILDVENLRERLRDLRAEQAEARRRYWQQVGPVAAAVVAARRSLFPALEEALLLGYFSRLEEVQITELIVGNARALEDRFGEDEGDLLRKYAPAGQRNANAASTQGPDERQTPPDATGK